MLEAKYRYKYTSYLIFLGVVLSLTIPIYDYMYGKPRSILLNQAATWLGIAMILSGIIMRWWAILTLGKFFTTHIQISKDHQLIQSGPYRLFRHPSYLGAWIAMMGISLLLQSVYGLMFSVVVYCFINAYRIECEEKVLLEQFPEDYKKYQEKTWRMIPYIY